MNTQEKQAKEAQEKVLQKEEINNQRKIANQRNKLGKKGIKLGDLSNFDKKTRESIDKNPLYNYAKANPKQKVYGNPLDDLFEGHGLDIVFKNATGLLNNSVKFGERIFEAAKIFFELRKSDPNDPKSPLDVKARFEAKSKTVFVDKYFGLNTKQESSLFAGYPVTAKNVKYVNPDGEVQSKNYVLQLDKDLNKVIARNFNTISPKRCQRCFNINFNSLESSALSEGRVLRKNNIEIPININGEKYPKIGDGYVSFSPTNNAVALTGFKFNEEATKGKCLENNLDYDVLKKHMDTQQNEYKQKIEATSLKGSPSINSLYQDNEKSLKKEKVQQVKM